MYDREVDDPRLSHWYDPGAVLPHPALVERLAYELCARIDDGRAGAE